MRYYIILGVSVKQTNYPTPSHLKMLLFQNIEGAAYNPNLDNYLVVKTTNLVDTSFEQLQKLLDLIENSHDELVMIECCSQCLELFTFLENISKLFILKLIQSTTACYLTIQKNLI